MITERDLIHPNERKYLISAVIASIIIYILLILSIGGIFFILFFLGLSLFSHALMMADIRMNGVKLSPSQFPVIFEKTEVLCEKMDIPLVPDVYVLQSGGVLNAFATRFFGRNMVVLYSEVFELIANNAGDELLFIIAHELAHIKRRHLSKQMLILPAMWVPFLSEAYSRACEYTCDRFGAYYLGNYAAAKNSLTVLAIGKALYHKVNQKEFIDQIKEEDGFFVWLIQSISTHPPLPKRIQEISLFESGEYTWRWTRGSKRRILAAVLILIVLTAAGYGVKTALPLINGNDFANYFSEQNSFLTEDNDLINAVVENDQTALNSLIKQGEDLEQADAEGWTALDWAIQDNNLEAATSLVNAGANVNHQDIDYVSPLMRASSLGNTEMMNLLLAKGSNIDEQDYNGDTPLIYAVNYQNKDAVKLLLDYGAGKGIKNNENNTALMYAIKSGDKDIITLLRAKEE